jgi:hypothetical protein
MRRPEVSSIRVLELAEPPAGLAELLPGDDVVATGIRGDGDNGATAFEAEDDAFDCAVALEPGEWLSSEPQQTAIGELRRVVRGPLLIAGKNGLEIETTRRALEDRGEIVSVISEAGLPFAATLGRMVDTQNDELSPAACGVVAASRLISASEGAPQTAILVARPPDHNGALDTRMLELCTAEDSPPAGEELALAIPLIRELRAVSERLAESEARSRRLTAEVALRDARRKDLAANLADICQLMATEQAAREEAERGLAEAQGTRGYRLGLASYRFRIRVMEGVRAAGRVVTRPVRAVISRLRPGQRTA